MTLLVKTLAYSYRIPCANSHPISCLHLLNPQAATLSRTASPRARAQNHRYSVLGSDGVSRSDGCIHGLSPQIAHRSGIVRTPVDALACRQLRPGVSSESAFGMLTSNILLEIVPRYSQPFPTIKRIVSIDGAIH
jgi:hypothetical protein